MGIVYDINMVKSDQQKLYLRFIKGNTYICTFIFHECKKIDVRTHL